MNRYQKMLTACDPPLTQKQGQDVYDQMKALEFHRGPMTPGLLFWVLPPAVLFFTAPFFFYLAFINGPYAILLWLGTIVPSLLVVYWQKRRNQRRNMIELGRLLRELGVRVHLCGRCNYDLRSITSDRCPECGEPIARKTERV